LKYGVFIHCRDESVTMHKKVEGARRKITFIAGEKEAKDMPQNITRLSLLVLLVKTEWGHGPAFGSEEGSLE
jgi:hypothetical protein